MKLTPYFQPTEGGDGVFNVEAVKIKFGFGALHEVGAEARSFGMTRVAIYTDKNVAKLEPVAIAVDSLKKEGLDAPLCTIKFFRIRQVGFDLLLRMCRLR